MPRGISSCRTAARRCSMQGETNVWRSIMLTLSKLGIKLFRNQRYKGKICRGDTVTNAYADCGVGGDGGSDLIGWRSLTIEPHHVGKRVAQFVAFETKTKTGTASDQQKRFVSAVKNDGGIAGVCRSDDDAIKLLEDW